jgi:hypothetical protein
MPAISKSPPIKAGDYPVLQIPVPQIWLNGLGKIFLSQTPNRILDHIDQFFPIDPDLMKIRFIQIQHRLTSYDSFVPG